MRHHVIGPDDASMVDRFEIVIQVKSNTVPSALGIVLPVHLRRSLIDVLGEPHLVIEPLCASHKDQNVYLRAKCKQRQRNTAVPDGDGTVVNGFYQPTNRWNLLEARREMFFRS